MLGVLAAFPFVGAGAAQAALAGAPPVTTNFRPDLRSVHILTGINAGRAQFCFDKPIASPTPGVAVNFRLGGYRWDTILTGLAPPVLDSTGMCAIVLMTPDNSGGAANLNGYSFATVANGAVTANISGGQANIADSTASLDSDSHSGTAGHTTGPDLAGVTVGSPAGTNEIIYTFDEPLDNTTANLDPFSFRYYDASGTIHFGVAITGTDGVGDVRVSFGAPPVTTSNAVIAYVYHGDGGAPEGVNHGPVGPGNGAGGGYSDTPNPETITPTESVTVPGTGGVTALPDLVTTTIVPGSTNQVDYSFDQVVALNTIGAFVAVTSNGDEIRAATATALSDGKTIRATFSGPNIANYLEELVVATVYDGGVRNGNGFLYLAQGKPVGGNAGAFATGYTNGPDATSVTLNGAAGQAVVTFDQRVAANSAGQPVDQTGATPTNLGQWVLLDQNGNFLANPTSATVESTGPFTSDVRLTFANPPTVGVSKALEICGNQVASSNVVAPGPSDPYVTWFGITTDGGIGGRCVNAGTVGAPGSAVFSFGNAHGNGVSGMNPAGNVQQIIAPTVSGASLQAKGTKIHLRWVHITHQSYLNAHRKHNHKKSKKH